MHTGGRRRGRPFGVPETRMVLFHFAALAPLAITAWSLAQGTLGPDLVSTLGRRSGRYALVFLLLSLVPSLLARLPRLAWVARLRRPLGLYTFGYAVLHLFTFVGLDYAFDWPLLLAAI